MRDSKSISTDREIAGLKATARPYWVTVTGYPGLRIKVSEGRKGTARAFAYRYKAPDGRQELKMIGRYDPPRFGLAEARETWRELRGIREQHGYVKAVLAQERAANVAAIEATTTQTERDAYTVAKLAGEFVEHQSKRIKTWRKTQSNLQVYALPRLGDRPAHAVRRRDVLEVLDALTQDGKKVTANRVLAALRAMYNWAIQREKHGIESNPCTAIKPPKERARERTLSDVELRRLFANLPATSLGDDERDLLTFILLTGCRLSEAAGAPASELDTAAALWVLPAGRSKNGREHRLPLSTQALALVERRTQASAHLFAQRRNPKRAMRGDTIHTPLREAIKALKVLPFTPHDLRRSTASGIAALGAPRDIVRRVLNHVDPTVTATYDRHDYTPEMRRWLQAWADHLDRLRGVHAAKKSTARTAGAGR